MIRWTLLGVLLVACGGSVSEDRDVTTAPSPEGETIRLNADGSHTRTRWQTLGPGNGWSLAASCETSEARVGGRCDAEGAFAKIVEDGPAGTGWGCTADNTAPLGGASIRLAVEVTCR